MSTREEGKTLRRKRIVKAARLLMQNSGEPGFSMRALAIEARVSIATPYNLFGSKEKILFSVMEDDLEQYCSELGRQNTDELQVFFDAVTLTTKLYESESTFYRAILNTVYLDGTDKYLASYRGPQHIVWKNMVKKAVSAGYLMPEVEADAFAINLRHGFLAAILQWAKGDLSIKELETRAHYHVALSLAAMSMPEARERLLLEIQDIQNNLQKIWQDGLRQAMASGPLDAVVAELAADQIALLGDSIGG
ncbi:MAG: AcrR family transcriptional regulator [Candidatus Azotimanducaceae bacterium]|jgi:AcrR family transcriptional regulator